MSGVEERTPEELVVVETGAPVADQQPTTRDGVGTQDQEQRRAVPDGGATIAQVLQEVRLLGVGLADLRRYVDNGFEHFEGRVNRSRERERELNQQLRSPNVQGMPALMPQARTEGG